MSTTTRPDERPVVVHFNRRNYSNGGEWEVWWQSNPIAHSKSIDRIRERYPNCTVVDLDRPSGRPEGMEEIK